MHGVTPSQLVHDLSDLGFSIIYTRHVGNTDMALITFEGRKVPRYISYRCTTQHCFPHRPIRQVCTKCLDDGHRVCPTSTQTDIPNFTWRTDQPVQKWCCDLGPLGGVVSDLSRKVCYNGMVLKPGAKLIGREEARLVAQQQLVQTRLGLPGPSATHAEESPPWRSV